jgi:hypothetical protein
MTFGSIYHEVEMIDKRTGNPIPRPTLASIYKSRVEDRARKLNDARTPEETHQIEFRCSEPIKSGRAWSYIPR